jgi:hypothetical protein
MDDEEREFTDEQLRAALRRMGEAVREEARRAGDVLTIVRGGYLVVVHPDGREERIEAVPSEPKEGAAG